MALIEVVNGFTFGIGFTIGAYCWPHAVTGIRYIVLSIDNTLNYIVKLSYHIVPKKPFCRLR